MLALFPAMVLKQKGKPEKGKKPVRGGPRQFSDHREFLDVPVEEFENLRVRTEGEGSESEVSGSEVESSEEEPIVPVNNKPAKPAPAAGNNSSTKPAGPAKPSTTPATPSSGTKELSRRDREAIQKEQARQHYLKMKEKEDAARLALVRKQREEAAAQHAEALRAKEAAKRR